MVSSAYHIRSNSLPSRPHPLTSEFDEHLNKLKASEATSTTATSICHTLNGLQDLYACVDKLLQLPLTQTTLAQEQHKKFFYELLDESLRPLDVCSIAKNALLQIKECAQELQSILRRRRWGKTELTSEVKKFLTSRKAVKTNIHSALENLKCMENKHDVSPSCQDKETGDIVDMLRERWRQSLSPSSTPCFPSFPGQSHHQS